METTDLLETRRPHPSPGWLAVQVVAESEIKPDVEEAVQPPEAVQAMIAKKMGISVEELRTFMEDNIVGTIIGLVLEVGEEPEAGQQGPNIYKVDDKIWFPADRGVPMGNGIRFLRWERVIGYDRADED